MKEIEMKDVMDALNTVYTEVELSHRDVVNIAAAVMPLFESVFIDYKLLEALKDQLMEENKGLEKKLRRYQNQVRRINHDEGSQK